MKNADVKVGMVGGNVRRWRERGGWVDVFGVVCGWSQRGFEDGVWLGV